jgi:hypothetical protein
MKHSMNDTTGLRMQKYNKHLIFGFLHITDVSTFFAFFLNHEKVVRHDWRGCQQLERDAASDSGLCRRSVCKYSMI